MISILEFIFFIIFDLFALKEAITYGIYEFKNANKYGGIFIILFSICVVISSIFALVTA